MLFDKIPKEKTKPYTLSFPPSFVEEVDLRAARLCVSRSVYLRLAAQDFFEKEDKKYQ